MEDGEKDTNDSAIESRIVEKAESWVNGLDDFFNETRHLFTLIGVFGAFSIYLRTTDLPETPPDTTSYTNIITFFGFGIVLLLLLIVLVKLINRIISPDPDEVMLRPENIPYLVFFLLLMPIVASIVRYLSTFTASAGLFWFSVAYLLGPISVFAAHDYLITDGEVHARIADKLGISRYTALGLMCVTTGLAGLIVIAWILYSYGPNVLDSLLAGERVSQRWLLFIAVFVTMWFYAATAGLLITVVRGIWAGFKTRLSG